MGDVKCNVGFNNLDTRFKSNCPQLFEERLVEGLALIPSLLFISTARLYPLPLRELSVTTKLAPERLMYSKVPKKSA